MTIVRTSYRYKRPPRKRKAVELKVPAIVRAGKTTPTVGGVSADTTRSDETTALPKRPAIVTIRRKPGRFGDVPEMTPEEHKQRGDAADELMRRFKREIAASKR